MSGMDAPSDEPEEEVARTAAQDPEGFLNLMGHYYRGELGRTTTWRTRMDRTTNWSVVITAAILTFAFSSRSNPHFVILGGIVTVTVFLLIEARRYRMYDVWRSRVRLLEENVFAEAIDPRGVEDRDWREMISEDLRQPKVKIPYREAVARRLKRVYWPILTLLWLAWIARITAFAPAGVPVLEQAGIASLPGLVVVAVVFGFYLLVFGLVIWPIERRAKGEMVKPGPGEEPEDWRNDE